MSEDKKEDYEYKEQSEEKDSNYTFRVSSKAVIVIVAIVALVVGFAAGFLLNSGAAPTGMVVSKDYVATKAQTYIQDIVGSESKVTISNVKDEGTVYSFDVKLDGDTFKSYMTKDGSLLFPSAYNLNQTIMPTQPEELQEPSKVQVSADDDPVKGDPDAPVTIIEFSDFQCPFCARFWKDTLPQIEENYIKTGKAKLVFRDFPLSFHQYAQKASEASECADEQGKFWEYHDKLFENQNALDIASLKQYAKDLGLNETKFNDCLDSDKMASEIQKDISDGQSYGVSGTPAFFINGILVSGAQPYSVFQQIIVQELNKTA